MLDISTNLMEQVSDVIDAPQNSIAATTLETIRDEKMKTPVLNMDTNERQRRYVELQKHKGGAGLGVVFQDAFIRGMRDIGYKDPAWAMAELIDNAIQASAQNVEIRFGFGAQNKSQAKNPEAIAIIDDGAGMIPEMISYAVRWGGTDREDDRRGFGRFGYGLPSSAVSIACRYTVYSKTKDSDWYAVTIDLQELAEASSDTEKTSRLLQPKPVSLPLWLLTAQKNGIDIGELSSGTIIVLEDLDRLKKMTGWILVSALKSKLLKHFGLIYRHWIPEKQFIVDGEFSQAVDPLFLMPHARLYDETPVMAKRVTTSSFEVDVPEKGKGTVRIRAALLPPQFSWATPENLSSGGKKNQRFKQILAGKEGLNGLLVCREGRQIDVVAPEWIKFQNNDVYVKIEIDFDPVLDEAFGVTTSKQQIVINESMWEKLKASGKEAGNLKALVKEMQDEWKNLSKALDGEVANLAMKTEEKLPSAEAMLAAEKLKSRTPHISDEKREEAEKNLVAKVQEEVKATGKSIEEVQKLLEESMAKRSWDIEFRAIEEGPFYIPKRLGNQKRIVINTAHPFYSRLYDQAENVRSAIEVMLFVLADGEIDADGGTLQFYRKARNDWSEMLRTALESLEPESMLTDRKASLAEAWDSEANNEEDVS